MDLIYCAGANRHLMQAALEAGWLLGVRSDRSSYGFTISFVDNEYRAPDWKLHLRRVIKEQPKYATVPDLSEEICSLADIERAIKQADELSNYCQIPLIVPKLRAQLAHIPNHYAIAYSIPSSYGGATFGPWLLEGRRVHLLGGSPGTQRTLYRAIREYVEVISADGNMAQKVGLSYADYWNGLAWEKLPTHVFQHDKRERGKEAVRRSFITIPAMWRNT